MSCKVLVGKGQLTEQLITHWTLKHHILFVLLLVFPTQPPHILHALLIPMVEVDVAPEGARGAVGFLTYTADMPAGVVGLQVVPVMGFNSSPKITLVTSIEVLGVITVVGVQPSNIGSGKVAVWACEGFLGHVFGTVSPARSQSTEQQLALTTRKHGRGISLF